VLKNTLQPLDFVYLSPGRLRPKQDDDDDAAPPSFTYLTLIAQATLSSDHLAIPRTIPFSSLSKILPEAFFDFHQGLRSLNAPPACPDTAIRKGYSILQSLEHGIFEVVCCCKGQGVLFHCNLWSMVLRTSLNKGSLFLIRTSLFKCLSCPTCIYPYKCSFPLYNLHVLYLNQMHPLSHSPLHYPFNCIARAKNFAVPSNSPLFR